MCKIKDYDLGYKNAEGVVPEFHQKVVIKINQLFFRKLCFCLFQKYSSFQQIIYSRLILSWSWGC